MGLKNRREVRFRFMLCGRASWTCRRSACIFSIDCFFVHSAFFAVVVFDCIYLNDPSLNQSSNSGARVDTGRGMFGRYLGGLSLAGID